MAFKYETAKLRHGPSDEQWRALSALVSDIQGQRGRHPTDEANRKFFHALLWFSKANVPWRDLPIEFGKWRSVHNRFMRWAKTGRLRRLFDEISKSPELWLLCMDSTVAKAAPCASGARKKKKSMDASLSRQKLGASHGGRGSKIHAVVDALGRPMAAIPTPAQRADAAMGPALAKEAAKAGAQAVAGDKAYDSNEIRDILSEAGVEAVIPSKKNRKAALPFDPEKYKGRNVVERFFRRMKECRRLALRCEKLACAYMGFFWLFAAMQWIKTP